MDDLFVSHANAYRVFESFSQLLGLWHKPNGQTMFQEHRASNEIEPTTTISMNLSMYTLIVIP
jgi:hypothetical protein